VLYFKDGAEAHKKQFALGVLEAAKSYQPQKAKSNVTVSDYILNVEYGEFECRFVKGMIASVKKGGEVIFDTPMKLNFHRAYIDNDGIPGLFPRRIGEWKYFMLHHFYFNLMDMEVEEKNDRVVVNVSGMQTVHSHYLGFFIKIAYEIFADGTILVNIKGEPYGMVPKVIPRIGVVFEMPEKYEKVRWLGRGPLENYPDSKANAPVSIYERAVDEMNFLYDMPRIQEITRIPMH
jgi:beta-galactosidase/beta-glucuronidase